MKAIVYETYGPPAVLQLKEVEKPVPKDNEILIRVHATTVNYGDLAARDFAHLTPSQFHMPFLFWLMARLAFGLRKPRTKILGSEFAGEVEAVGSAVTQFKAGDPVFGYPGQRMGAYAEYLCMPEEGTVASKPTNMSFEEAAVLPYGAIMALNLLRKADLQRGQTVLINGASGSIGSAAVQLAKRHFGATVTGVCGAPRMDFVKSLGADQVIDYRNVDFCRSGERYDLIFDVLGKGSFSRCKSALEPNGRYLFVSFKMKQLLQLLWTSVRGDKKVICAIAPGSPEDLHAVKNLIEAGKIKAEIDRRFPLAQAAEAHRYVEAGRKTGQVVITV